MKTFIFSEHNTRNIDKILQLIFRRYYIKPKGICIRCKESGAHMLQLIKNRKDRNPFWEDAMRMFGPCLSTSWFNVWPFSLLEAIFLVDAVPHSVGRRPLVASVALRIQQEVHVLHVAGILIWNNNNII